MYGRPPPYRPKLGAGSAGFSATAMLAMLVALACVMALVLAKCSVPVALP